jgi:hypothetical protein
MVVVELFRKSLKKGYDLKILLDDNISCLLAMMGEITYQFS